MEIINIPIPEVQQFNFTLGTDKTVYSIPLLQYLPKHIVDALVEVQRIEDENLQADKSERWLESLLHTYCPKLDIDQQPLSVFKALFEAWQNASNLTVGESPASADSTTNTQGHSNTISSHEPDTSSPTSRKRSTGSR